MRNVMILLLYVLTTNVQAQSISPDYVLSVSDYSRIHSYFDGSLAVCNNALQPK